MATINSSGIPIPVPVVQGGTGETTAASALTNLGALPTAGGTMTGYLILNADPTTNLGAATKQYVDNVATGIIIKTPCLCGSTANFTATYSNGTGGIGATLTNSGSQAAFSTDGVTPALNSRVLVKNQTSTFQNGVYTLTTVGSGSSNWVLTRATDYDTAAQIVPGTLIVVQTGAVNAITSWLETATVVTVGTDPIVFTQFTAGVGANISLSNLTTTSINESLLPAADITYDLGAQNLRWTNLYAEFIKTGQTATNTLNIEGYNTGGSSYTNFFAVTAGNPPTAVLGSSVTATTQSALDNSTKLATTAYVDAATGGGAGANVHLSNLSSVAINASLIAGTDGTLDLGSAADRWRNALVETIQTGTTAAQTTLLQAYNTNTTSYTTFATLTANNPPTMVLASGVTGTTQSALDNSTKLATTAYVDAATGGGAGANAALSNLASVAVNTSLVPGSDNSIDLGTAAHRWRNAIVETIQTGTTAAQTTLLQAYNTNTTSYTTFATLTANNPPTMAMASTVTGVTQSPLDNSTKLATTAYTDTAVTAGAGANKALSNLASVAINTALLPASDGGESLGNASFRWANTLTETIQTGTTAAQTTVLQAYNTNTTSYTTFATLTANNPPTMVLASAVTGTTQSPGDNSTKLATTAYVAAALPSLPLSVANGGTGDSTLTTAYGTLCAGTTATGAVQTVSPGSSGNPLVSGGASALPSYSNLLVGGGGTGVTTFTTAYGTVCAGTTGTGALQTVSPGSSGAPLVSGGASALPSYTTLLVGGGGTGLTTATTAYSPICAGTTATGAFQSASTGLSTSGYVFTSNGSSSLPSFQTIGASSAGLVLITSGSASSQASISFAQCFTSSYNNYRIVFTNVNPATSNAVLYMQIGTGAGPSYQTSSYLGIYQSYTSVSAAFSTTSTTSGFLLGGGQYTGVTTEGISGHVEIYNVNDATNYKTFVGQSFFVNTTPAVQSTLTAQVWQGATILTSVKFIMSSGNINSGNFYIYGYHN